MTATPISRPAGRPARRAGIRALALAGLLCAGTAQAADPVVGGELLLRLDSNAAWAPLQAKYGLSLVGRFGSRPIFRVRVPAGSSVQNTITQLVFEPGVLNAEPNTVHSSPEARKNNVFAIGTAQQYAQQWVQTALRLSEAHQISTGAGVRVAVLDTGVDRSHPALVDRLLPGHDFVDGDTDPSEAPDPTRAGYGHGTHVAGLVAMVAPGAKIMPLRVLDADGRGNAWVLAEALLYAIDPDRNPATDDGAQVINMSLGSLDRTTLFASISLLASCNLPPDGDPAAAEYADAGYNDDKQRCATSRGAVVTAAVGNGGSKSERQYPAAESVYGLLSVAASNASGRLASFSNYGSWVDVAAPGEAVTSSLPGTWGTWSGTSMAAPMAAGTAALLRSAAPAMRSRVLLRRIECTATPLRDGKLPQISPLGALRTVVGGDRGCP